MGSRADDTNSAFTGLTARRRGNALPMSPMRRRHGFTLIELMITVAIVGILAAIAYPSYQEQVRKSRRGQAKADLTEMAQILERNFTEANRYDQNSTGGALRDVANVPLAPLFSTSPRTGTAYYTITLPTLTASTFTLNAAPTGAQAGDRCGTYTLNQAGTKTATGPADCW